MSRRPAKDAVPPAARMRATGPGEVLLVDGPDLRLGGTRLIWSSLLDEPADAGATRVALESLLHQRPSAAERAADLGGHVEAVADRTGLALQIIAPAEVVGEIERMIADALQSDLLDHDEVSRRVARALVHAELRARDPQQALRSALDLAVLGPALAASPAGTVDTLHALSPARVSTAAHRLRHPDTVVRTVASECAHGWARPDQAPTSRVQSAPPPSPWRSHARVSDAAVAIAATTVGNARDRTAAEIGSGVLGDGYLSEWSRMFRHGEGVAYRVHSDLNSARVAEGLLLRCDVGVTLSPSALERVLRQVLGHLTERRMLALSDAEIQERATLLVRREALHGHSAASLLAHFAGFVQQGLSTDDVDARYADLRAGAPEARERFGALLGTMVVATIEPEAAGAHTP